MPFPGVVMITSADNKLISRAIEGVKQVTAKGYLSVADRAALVHIINASKTKKRIVHKFESEDPLTRGMLP